jgi:hypothetical protein
LGEYLDGHLQLQTPVAYELFLGGSSHVLPESGN